MLDKIWERQPWDTDRSYSYFRDFFLPLEPKERSLAEAYRRYRSSQGYGKVDTAQVPGSWANWYRGANIHGKKPKNSVYEHALSWAKRAEAYDQYLWQQEQDIWISRRRKLKEQEWDLGERLIRRAEDMLKAILFERTTDGPNGQTIIVKPTNWSETDIGRTLDLALKLQRRAADMDQGKLAVEHDWKQQLEAAGLNAGEAFEKLVNELVNGIAKSSNA
jgi:hypothetical protein